MWRTVPFTLAPTKQEPCRPPVQPNLVLRQCPSKALFAVPSRLIARQSIADTRWHVTSSVVQRNLEDVYRWLFCFFYCCSVNCFKDLHLPRRLLAASIFTYSWRYWQCSLGQVNSLRWCLQQAAQQGLTHSWKTWKPNSRQMVESLQFWFFILVDPRTSNLCKQKPCLSTLL